MHFLRGCFPKDAFSMSPPAPYIPQNEEEGSMYEWFDCNKHRYQVCIITDNAKCHLYRLVRCRARCSKSVVNNGYWLVSSMPLYNIKIKMVVVCVFVSFVSDNPGVCSKYLKFAYPWSATTPLERPILSCIWGGRTSGVLLYSPSFLPLNQTYVISLTLLLTEFISK